MKVSYKGTNHELSPKIQKKLDARFAKLSKLLEKRGEQEAHVVVTSERHLHCAEITIQFYDHQLIGKGSDADMFNALSEAFEKLESQAVKNRGKWREKRREDRSAMQESAADAPVKAAAGRNAGGSTKLAGVVASSKAASEAQRIFRVNNHEKRKPMTLDEAVMEMEKGQDYLVYRDTDKDRVSVLVRRPDGHFDLIEG